MHRRLVFESNYRVTKVVADLGLVGLDLGSSPGSWAATVATYCPNQMVQHPKSKSTQLRSATTLVTLYYPLLVKIHPFATAVGVKSGSRHVPKKIS